MNPAKSVARVDPLGAEEDLERARAGRFLGAGGVEASHELARSQRSVPVGLGIDGRADDREPRIVGLDLRVFPGEDEGGRPGGERLTVATEPERARAGDDEEQRVPLGIRDGMCGSRRDSDFRQRERRSVGCRHELMALRDAHLPQPSGRVRKFGGMPGGPQTRRIPSSSVAPIPSGIGAPCALGLLGLRTANHDRTYGRIH